MANKDKEKQTITITFDPETDDIKLNMENVSSFKDIFGLLKHAEMQLICQYNERYYKDECDEDESLFQ